MKNKFINYIFVFFLVILFSFFYGKEYFQFHQKNNEIKQNLLSGSNLYSSFSKEKIRNIDKIEIFKTPDKSLIKTISNKIINSKNRVYVEAYILTETTIQKALVDAAKKGVLVKVILEKNVYMAPNLNQKAFDFLQKNKVKVIWSDSKDYSLNHSKYFVIDNDLIISTGNFSYSLFTKNRDFLLFITDKTLLNSVIQNFNYDFLTEKNYYYDDNLVLSPVYSREKIEFLLKNSKKSIKMYFPYFSDDDFMQLLKDKQKLGVKIQIITDKKNASINELLKNGFEVKVLNKLTEHAKVILIDDNLLYVGSINFSSSSLDKNREMGILTIDKTIISKIIGYFNDDFK